jgi:deazaflavin-dependent oxidoreductase (nitroreductase family)
MGVYSRFMLGFIRRAEAVPVMHNVLVPLDRVLFRATKGRASLAHFGAGKSQVMQNLLLRTVGRKSGKPRDNPVLFLDHDGGWVVVGSRYGTDSHPGWTYNLLADPRAKVIVRGREHPVTARKLTPGELQALWPALIELYPAWQDYRERTEREFRAFHLTPA